MKTGVAHYDKLEPIDVSHIAILERLALRNPPGEWHLMRCDRVNRLFLRVRPGDKGAFLSRYVWDWRQTDEIVSYLLRKAAAA